MSKDIQWFKHDADASSDLAIEAMFKRYGYAGFGLYWEIIGRLRRLDDYRMRYGDVTFDGLSKFEFKDAGEVKSFVDDCIDVFHLFEKEDECFFSARLRRDMQEMVERRKKFQEAGRKSAEKRYGQQPDIEAPAPAKEVKHKYGEYKNVLLTDEEYRKLNEKLGEVRTAELIKAMSEWLKIKGVTYKDYYLALLNWDRRDKEGDGGTHKRGSSRSEKRFQPDKPLR